MWVAVNTRMTSAPRTMRQAMSANTGQPAVPIAAPTLLKRLGRVVRNSSFRLNLALQGGGAHGAFTWGVLDALLEDLSLSKA